MNLKNLESYNLILASASPRRQELLAQLGIAFEVKLKPVAEDYPGGMDEEEIALYLCKKKADAFTSELKNNNTIIITADTIVCLKGEILGKPSNREEAISSLKKLSAKKHSVITGVCIKSGMKEVNFAVSTDVYFKELRDDEIIHYVDKYKPFDKAGAYGIQEWIGFVGVERIDGSFYNVMGLPVLKLYEELRKF